MGLYCHPKRARSTAGEEIVWGGNRIDSPSKVSRRWLARSGIVPSTPSMCMDCAGSICAVFILAELDTYRADLQRSSSERK
jgi:hypothetical protein